jgi:hypothetical protein
MITKAQKMSKADEFKFFLTYGREAKSEEELEAYSKRMDELRAIVARLVEEDKSKV